jgi:hypothetical protein
VVDYHVALTEQHKQTLKALIHNNIEAFMFVTTETILKHFLGRSYYVYMYQVPGISKIEGFWGWRE